MDGQGTKWHRNIAENFNRLSRVHQRYRRQTDGRPMTYSEPKLEFTFAKKIYEYNEKTYNIIYAIPNLQHANKALAHRMKFQN